LEVKLFLAYLKIVTFFLPGFQFSLSFASLRILRSGPSFGYFRYPPGYSPVLRVLTGQSLLSFPCATLLVSSSTLGAIVFFAFHWEHQVCR